MRTVTYWIPAPTLTEAGVIARALHRGAVPRMPWHSDETACQRRADACNEILGARPVKPYAVVIEERAVDDGLITNAWRADAVGKIAASVATLYAGCWLVGLGTFL